MNLNKKVLVTSSLNNFTLEFYNFRVFRAAFVWFQKNYYYYDHECKRDKKFKNLISDTIIFISPFIMKPLKTSSFRFISKDFAVFQ